MNEVDCLVIHIVVSKMPVAGKLKMNKLKYTLSDKCTSYTKRGDDRHVWLMISCLK